MNSKLNLNWNLVDEARESAEKNCCGCTSVC